MMERFEENSRRTQRVKDVQTVLSYLTLPVIERTEIAQLPMTQDEALGGTD